MGPCALCHADGRLEHLQKGYVFCDACGFVYAVDDDGAPVDVSETQRSDPPLSTRKMQVVLPP